MRLVELIGLVALALLGSLRAGPASASALDVLESCSAARPASTRGLEPLASQCPSLEAALTELGYDSTLPEGWRENLTREQLAQLARLARSEARDHPDTTRALPDVAALRGILADLAREHAVPRSWWESLTEWLRSRFRHSDSRELSWLERWLERMSGLAGAMTGIAYALVIVVIVGSVIYLARELRASGALRRPAARPRSGRSRGRVPAAPAASAEALAAAAALDQPALVLALIVRRLKEVGRLAADRHLTHRELARAAQLDEPWQHRRLAELADIAEQILYGAQPPSLPVVASAVDGGRALLEDLGASRAAARTATVSA